VGKKPKEVDALKKKLAEQDAKKAKDMEEKLAELKKKGLSSDDFHHLSIFDKIIREAEENESRDKFDKEMDIIDLFENEKSKEKL
jgi:uncharacterized protein (DUF885 family)